jgi:hypothetical protein
MIVQTWRTVRTDSIPQTPQSSFITWGVYPLQHVLSSSSSGPHSGCYWGSQILFHELNQGQFDKTPPPYISPLPWSACFTVDAPGAFGPNRGCDTVIRYWWPAATRFHRQKGGSHLWGLAPDGAIIWNWVISPGAPRGVRDSPVKGWR